MIPFKHHQAKIFRIIGIDDAAYAAAATVAAAGIASATSVHNANQANAVAQGTGYNSNYINIISQLQNQDYNSAEAAKSRIFNASEADIARHFSAGEAGAQRQYATGERLAAQGFNAEQAELNRQFQREQTGTAYQRAVKDMKAAGLNPMLAYQQGGASSATGSAASVAGATGAAASGQAAQGAQASSGGGRPASPNQVFKADSMQMPQIGGVIQAMRLKAEIENIEADTEQKKATVPKTQQETKNLTDTQTEIKTRIKLLEEETTGQTAKNYGYAWDNRLKEITNDLMLLDKQLKTKQISLTEANTRQANISARLDELQEKKYENQEAIDKTPWGEKGRPILDDVGKVTGTARGVSDILRSRGR